MNGTPLVTADILTHTATYIGTPATYKSDLMDFVQQGVRSAFPIEQQLALLHPECWLSLPCLSSWVQTGGFTPARKAVQEVYGKISWVKYTPSVCECGSVNCPGGSTYAMDHFYPVSSGGPFWRGNLKMLTRVCNQMKCNSIGTYVGSNDVSWRFRAAIQLFGHLASHGCYAP